MPTSRLRMPKVVRARGGPAWGVVGDAYCGCSRGGGGANGAVRGGDSKVDLGVPFERRTGVLLVYRRAGGEFCRAAQCEGAEDYGPRAPGVVRVARAARVAGRSGG